MNQMNPMGMYGYQPQYQPRQRLLKCFPVTSIEEARSSMIDLDGSLTVFTDIANGKIYTKQVDLNGMAVMQTYELVQTPLPQSLEQRIDNLEALIGEMKGELNDVKQSNIPADRTAQRKSKSTGNDESVVV